MTKTSLRIRQHLLLFSFVIFSIKCLVSVTAQDADILLANSNNQVDSELNSIDDSSDRANHQTLNDYQIETLSKFLSKLLLIPWPNGASPLLYVEKFPSEVYKEDLRDEIFDEPSEIEDEQGMRPVSPKRSRYYRKYPWKRQNNRYEPSYMCTPKKDDVFRLLLALHGERNGKRGQLVDFCNRKRPASLVFTNIRFVG